MAVFGFPEPIADPPPAQRVRLEVIPGRHVILRQFSGVVLWQRVGLVDLLGFGRSIHENRFAEVVDVDAPLADVEGGLVGAAAEGAFDEVTVSEVVAVHRLLGEDLVTAGERRHKQALAAELPLRRKHIQEAHLAAATAEAKVQPLVPRVAVNPQRVLQRHAEHLSVRQIQHPATVQKNATLVNVACAFQQIFLAVDQLPIEQKQRVRIIPQIRRHSNGVDLQKQPCAVHADWRAFEAIESRLNAR